MKKYLFIFLFLPFIVNAQRYYDVKTYPFNAKGNGTTDDRAAIQRALDSCGANNGGIVYAPHGTYIIDTTNHPNISGYSPVGLVIKSNTTLCGAGINSTIFKRVASTRRQDILLRNYNCLYNGKGDSNIVIRDMTFDGNASSNSGADTCQKGIYLDNCYNVTIENVWVKNIYGVSSGGVGESFTVSLQHCRDAKIINSISQGNTTSSTGFALNSCTDVQLINCKGFDFAIGAGGFTQWNCKNISYYGCWAWNNVYYSGFNNEESDNTVYTNCVAGFLPDVTDLSPLWSGVYPYENGDTLGNQHGFVFNGGYGKHFLNNCIAEYNPIHGVQITKTKQIIIHGGSYCNNTGYGINQYTGEATDTTFYLYISGAIIKGNVGVHQISTIYEPYVDDEFNGNMIYSVYDTTDYYTIKTPRIKLNTDSLVIKNLSDGYIPIAKGGAGGALINSSIYSNLSDAIPGYAFIGNRNDMIYLAKTNAYADQVTLGYNKIAFVGSGGSATIASYNIPMYLIMNSGFIEKLSKITLTNSNTIEDEASYIKFNGGLKLGTALGVAYGGTGATTLTGLLKGNGTGSVTAITAGTSAQFVRGDFTVQDLNQAAITGLSTSDTPTFEGVIVGGSATATAGSIKYSGGHLYFYNGAGWVQLAEETP